ncbi:proline-rich protein 2-like [Pteropus medius]|uniref:proline-rich protein 2-like n=1 Tax=Pteropus vampyrus TaxID=132908 RepID=UPI00196B8B59|nr:proline-rich protein 2-like [Pteropus giganteus]
MPRGAAGCLRTRGPPAPPSAGPAPSSGPAPAPPRARPALRRPRQPRPTPPSGPLPAALQLRPCPGPAPPGHLYPPVSAALRPLPAGPGRARQVVPEREALRGGWRGVGFPGVRRDWGAGSRGGTRRPEVFSAPPARFLCRRRRGRVSHDRRRRPACTRLPREGKQPAAWPLPRARLEPARSALRKVHAHPRESRRRGSSQITVKGSPQCTAGRRHKILLQSLEPAAACSCLSSRNLLQLPAAPPPPPPPSRHEPWPLS